MVFLGAPPACIYQPRPEYCPESYYAHYPDIEDIPLAKNPEPPISVPAVAVQTSKAFRHWLNVDNNTACDTECSSVGIPR